MISSDQYICIYISVNIYHFMVLNLEQIIIIFLHILIYTQIYTYVHIYRQVYKYFQICNIYIDRQIQIYRQSNIYIYICIYVHIYIYYIYIYIYVIYYSFESFGNKGKENSNHWHKVSPFGAYTACFMCQFLISVCWEDFVWLNNVTFLEKFPAFIFHIVR